VVSGTAAFERSKGDYGRSFITFGRPVSAHCRCLRRTLKIPEATVGSCKSVHASKRSTLRFIVDSHLKNDLRKAAIHPSKSPDAASQRT